MTNMIERVADAIISQHDTYHSTFLDSARAAIAAMREPTEAMVDAAVKDHDNHASHMTSYHCVMEAWRNMIDAALEEK